MTIELTSTTHCPDCGSILPTGPLAGLCPQCLLDSTLGSQTPPSDTSAQIPFAPSLPCRFAQYQLLEIVGRGAAGTVFRARDESLGREVAIKALHSGPLASRESIRRFFNEARVAARLSHPHIAPVYEVAGGDQIQPFVVMPFLPGGNLADKLKKHTEESFSDFQLSAPTPPPPGSPFVAPPARSFNSFQQIAQLLHKIASAVHHAHQHGILHRDLKPANILFDSAGEPYVADFGLARVLEEESTLTLENTLLGTPAYMSPEQATGSGEFSIASDIYSLGAILYELLTGRPPFVAPTIAATLRAIVEESPAPVGMRSTASHLSSDLETICLKCLEKDPSQRYPTAQALADDLRHFLNNEPISARPITRTAKLVRWSQRNPALATAYSLLILLLILILISSPLAIYRINQARKAEASQHQLATQEALRARQFQYASDMNRAHQALETGDFFRARQLLDSWIPVGTTVDREKTSRTDLRGWEWRYLSRECEGDERFILGRHTNGATAVGVLPDGKTAFSAGRDKLVRLWNIETRQQVDALEHPEVVLGAAASPDGHWLATVTENVRIDVQPVRLWDLPARKIAAVLATDFWPRSTLTFSPNSKLLAWVDNYNGVHIWDTTSQREIANCKAYYPFIGPLGAAFSPDSRTLAYNEDASGLIRLWDVANQASVGKLVGHLRSAWALDYSPDGRFLASASRDRTIRVWRLDTLSELFAVTNLSGIQATIAFSPDGRTLAAGGWEQQIRLIDAQTGLQTAHLKGHLQAITGLAFARDGHALLSSSLDGTVRIWDVPPRPKTPSALALPSDVSLDWNTYGPALCLSSDARFLLVVHTDQTFMVCNTLQLTTGTVPLPMANPTSAAVAPGGQQAAFANASGAIILLDLASGQSRNFAQIEPNPIHRLMFSLDGKQLAVGSGPAIDIFEVTTRKQTHHFPVRSLSKSLVFSPDARNLIAGFDDGGVKFWDLDGTAEPITFLGHQRQVRSLALLPDGKGLISTSEDIRFWDLRDQRQKALLAPRPAWFFACALTPDGRRLAAAASDGLVTIWDTATNQEVATLRGHTDFVRHLAFTPDGDYLVSVSEDRICVWRAAVSNPNN